MRVVPVALNDAVPLTEAPPLDSVILEPVTLTLTLTDDAVDTVTLPPDNVALVPLINDDTLTDCEPKNQSLATMEALLNAIKSCTLNRLSFMAYFCITLKAPIIIPLDVVVP